MEKGCTATASEARSEVLREAAGLERLSKEFEKLLTILVDKLTQVLLPDQPPGPSKIEVEPDVQTPLGQNLHSTRFAIRDTLGKLDTLIQRIEL